MKRLRVTSEALSSIGYNARQRVLEIEFSSGDVYDYTGVPPEIFQELMEAPSHGRFFQEHIRDRYPYIKLG